MPAINQAYTKAWTEQDFNTYHRMPYWMAKGQTDELEQWTVHDGLLGDMAWEPNSGDTGRIIRRTRPPLVRQSFNPQRQSALPKVDVSAEGERQTPFYVYHHIHESPTFNFYPAFTDFYDHTTSAVQVISQQQRWARELFYRTYIFHQSPAVFFPNRSGTSTVSSIGSEVVVTTGNLQANGDEDWSTGKSLAWLATQLPRIGQPGNLSINAISLACTYMTQQGMKPYRGSGMPQGPDLGLSSQYLLVLSGEAFDQFIYDPWLLKYKNIQLDIIYNKNGREFKGNFLGRWTTTLEQYPLRFLLNTDGSVSVPAPETVVIDSTLENAGETVPNPDYLRAQYEVAWLYSGEEHYKRVKIGAPPSMFKSGGAPKGFQNLQWNGEIRMVTNLLLNALNENDEPIQMLNEDGFYVKAKALTTYSVAGTQKRGVLPIIFRRIIGARNPVLS